jgi:hypothetical protein
LPAFAALIPRVEIRVVIQGWNVKNKIKMRMTALATCLFSGVAAHAVPVTYDFTGSGSVCTYASNAGCASTYTGAFTGSVTIDVLAAGPSGPDSYTDGSSMAYDFNGWAQTDFLIHWGGNSFNPSPVPAQTSSDNYVQLANDWGHADHLSMRESYFGSDGTTEYSSIALLTRQTADLSWLTGLWIPQELGFAPGPSAFNQILFDNSTVSAGVYSGFNGRIDLSSFSARARSVPEPGSLALLVFGLAGIALVRRSRGYPVRVG